MVAFRCSIRISRARWTYGAALAAAPSISFAHAPGLVALWPFDPVGALLLAVLAVIYARGSRRLSQRSAVPRSRHAHAISFWTGWASLVFALGPPLELWTDRSFAAHMGQHEILMLIAAPLLVAAKPMGVGAHVLICLPQRQVEETMMHFVPREA